MSLTPVWRTADGRLWAMGYYNLEPVFERRYAATSAPIGERIHDRWGGRPEPWSEKGGVYYEGPWMLSAAEVDIQPASASVEIWVTHEDARRAQQRATIG